MKRGSTLIITDKSKQLPIVISVAFASFMVCLDTYIVNVSLPTISEYFNVSTSIVSWVIIAYLLVVTSSMLIFGKLSDKVGLKKIFILGYFFFALGSFLCGTSPNITMLIAFRCLQGLGGAMLYTTAFAIIPGFLPANRIGWGFGIVSTTAALGITVGAPLGGFITGFFSWHWIFLINVPVGIIAILFAIKVMPEEKTKIETPKELIEEEEQVLFDFTGALLSVLGLIALLYALSRGQESGWTSPVILSCFTASAVLLFIFVLWEKRHPDPLLDIRLFKNLDFTFGILAAFMGFMLIAGGNFLLPFYLELTKGLKVEQVGLVMMTYSIVYMAVGPFAGRLSDKISPRFLCVTGMFSATIACFVFAFVLKLQGLLPIIIFLCWLAISFGMFISPNNNLVMGSAPGDKQGIAAATFKTISNFSLVLGVCFFETIFAQAMPQRVGTSNTSLIETSISPDILFSGFHNAYIFGGFVCLAGLAFSIFTKAKRLNNGV